MKNITRLVGVGGIAVAATALFAGPARASTDDHATPVFVQTDNLAGNAIVAYDRSADGSLTPAGSVPATAKRSPEATLLTLMSAARMTLASAMSMSISQMPTAGPPELIVVR